MGKSDDQAAMNNQIGAELAKLCLIDLDLCALDSRSRDADFPLSDADFPPRGR